MMYRYMVPTPTIRDESLLGSKYTAFWQNLTFVFVWCYRPNSLNFKIRIIVIKFTAPKT
jgi:hypothetical protein